MPTLQERWNLHFDYLDANDDGFLTIDDCVLTMDRFIASRDIDPESEIADVLRGTATKAFGELARADYNQDGQVTHDEWLRWHMETLDPKNTGEMMPTDPMIAQIRGEFSVYDVNGNGSIDRDDYLAIMQVLAPQYPEPLLREHWVVLAREYGTDGQLSFDQYIVACIKMRCSQQDLPFWVPMKEHARAA